MDHYTTKPSGLETATLLCLGDDIRAVFLGEGHAEEAALFAELANRDMDGLFATPYALLDVETEDWAAVEAKGWPS